MKTSILTFALFVLLVSCGEKLIEPPKNLIPQDRMVQILKDMAIMNAAKGTNAGRLKEYAIEPTQYVLDKYAVDSAQFVDSDRYYASQPAQYEEIYTEVRDLLTNEGERMAEIKKVKDSLRNEKTKNLSQKIKDSLKEANFKTNQE